MKDRIRLIMEDAHLSPSEFADKLHIGRAVISHILNGRNNPSLDVVTRILSNMKNINPTWLLTGEGNMFNSEIGENTSPYHPADLFSSVPSNDLFSQPAVNAPDRPNVNEYRKENIVEPSANSINSTVFQQVMPQKQPDKKISKIIIYYTDNTFEVFNADHKPL